MTKSKSGGLARLPKEQKCHFLIGPVSSWFMPNTTDLWTRPADQQSRVIDDHENDVIMDCDTKSVPKSCTGGLSYFVYGSIGCFCYGEIYHRPQQHDRPQQSSTSLNQVGAIVTQLIDIKDDNSRVSCTRFLKESPFPIILALTESGSLLIHDCIQNENLVHFKKSEVLLRFADLPTSNGDQSLSGCNQPNAKRAKFNITQQINSCSWPRADTILLGISLIREKTCLLSRLTIKDVLDLRNKPEHVQKGDIVVKHDKIDLDLPQYASPLCLVETAMLDKNICIIAVGMDDGLITVISYNLETNQKLRTIKLARHHDQICSMSIDLSDTRKFPLGLLASVSRDSLVLIWNIENENYFADYMAISGAQRDASKINWFSLRFVRLKGVRSSCLAVSNVDSGLTILEIPENTRSKIRLMESREAKLNNRQAQNDQVIKHNALIFNIEFDAVNETLITSSLDGNQVLWSVKKNTNENPNQSSKIVPIEVKPQFLIAAMPNNARTHMLRFNPFRENLLCMTLGKAGIRFHHIAENIIDSRFDMTQSCSLIARKVAKANVSPTSVAWHPNHEYRLAIGTLDGIVYRADITPRKALLSECGHQTIAQASAKSSLDEALGVEYQPISREVSNLSSRNSNQRPKTDGVYSLSWGPNPTNPQDLSRYAIYAIGSVSHSLFIYHSNKDNSDKLTNYLDEFHDKSLPEAVNQASEVAWKSSMDYMALGTIDGRVLIVTYLEEDHQERSNSKLFKILAVISGPFGKAPIQCLVWHPTGDAEDLNYHKIVASSNESAAFVFNLKETILVADVKERLRLEQSKERHSNMPDTATNMLCAYTNKLDAHQKPISDIAWSPHEPNQLATCSFDKTCYVWSLDNSLMDAQIISKFSGRDRLFTLEWSLVDENLIYTSGNDSIIWAWRPTENRV